MDRETPRIVLRRRPQPESPLTIRLRAPRVPPVVTYEVYLDGAMHSVDRAQRLALLRRPIRGANRVFLSHDPHGRLVRHIAPAGYATRVAETIRAVLAGENANVLFVSGVHIVDARSFSAVQQGTLKTASLLFAAGVSSQDHDALYFALYFPTPDTGCLFVAAPADITESTVSEITECYDFLAHGIPVREVVLCSGFAGDDVGALFEMMARDVHERQTQFAALGVITMRNFDIDRAI